MKSIISTILFVLLISPVHSQVISGEQKSISLTKKKEQKVEEIKLFPQLQIENTRFTNDNHNNFLEAKENAILEISIRNNGNGIAKGVELRISNENKSFKGLDFVPSQIVGDIHPNEIRKVSLVISGNNKLQEGLARLKIEVIEKNGFNTSPVNFEIRTRPKALPMALNWKSPHIPDSSVYNRTFAVSVIIQSGSEIKNINFFNNRLAQDPDYKITNINGDFLLEYDQNLYEGENALKIHIENEEGLTIDKTRNISFINEKRLALVIGNADYLRGGSLFNPVNDAIAMAEVLKSVGFDVMIFKNTSQKEMKKAIDEFGVRLRDYDIALFYYAGHGIQSDGRNYLIPVEAQLKSLNDVEYDCVRAGRVLSKMEYAATDVNMIILDACRDNPFERSWSRSGSGKGLAFMGAPSGSLIAYATSPGNTAADGTGKNGLYTSALLKYIQVKGLQIEDVFKSVRNEVENLSGGMQTPWETTSLKGRFYFKR